MEQTAEKFLKMDDIKLIIEVGKYNELYKYGEYTGQLRTQKLNELASSLQKQQSYSSKVEIQTKGAHPVLGCLVMILSFLQPVLALMRCGQQHPLRFLFNWSHSLNAVVIKTLAVAAIFTGLKLIDSTLDRWLMKVMGGFVGWESLSYILLEVHLNCTVSNTDTLKSKKITVILLMVLFCLGNCAFLVALLVGIGMS